MVSFPEELAKAVSARRAELNISTREELSKLSKISTRTLGDIENARKPSYARSTLWALDSVMEWERGSSERVLEGGKPKVEEEKPSPPADLHSGFTLPSGVLEGLSEAEQAEVRAAAVDAAFVRAREIRSSRPILTGEAPTHANWEPHTDRLHAQGQ